MWDDRYEYESESGFDSVSIGKRKRAGSTWNEALKYASLTVDTWPRSFCFEFFAWTALPLIVWSIQSSSLLSWH